MDQWFAEVPEAGDDHFAVVCLYTIDGEREVVRCAAITTLRRPII